MKLKRLKKLRQVYATSAKRAIKEGRTVALPTAERLRDAQLRSDLGYNPAWNYKI